MIAALIAAGLTGAWLIPHHTARGDVAHYIDRANAKGTEFAKQYRDVSAAYRSFRLKPGASAAAETARLQRAATRLTQLRVELAAIAAPPQAKELRTRLIAFYRKQEQVAHEIADITAYFPKLAAAEQPLRPAADRMRKAIRAAKTPTAQAAALKPYGDELARAAEEIAAVSAPAILAKAQSAEQTRLARTAKAVRGVEAALAAHNRVALNKAIAKLGVASTAASDTTRAAILAYNRHVEEIRTLGAKVERERQRLDRTLA